MIRLLIFALMLSHATYIYAEDKTEDKNKVSKKKKKKKKLSLRLIMKYLRNFLIKKRGLKSNLDLFQVQPTTPLLALV